MLSTRQLHCLKGIGITLWTERSSSHPVEDETPLAEPINNTSEMAARTETATILPVPSPQPSIDAADLIQWPALETAIQSCHQCLLGDSCTRKVPGKGNQQADVLIIGEAPGHEEDQQGKPFVGRAGQLLDRMLMAIEVDPQQVYITNILKCRPPNNRDPRVEEIQSCSQFLQAQIQLVKPRVIFSVGRISAQSLLQEQAPLGRLRDRQHILPGSDIPLLVTYHPAYLLRNPVEKAKVWQDLKSLKRLLQHATD